jgi:hypothetical protein
MLRYFFHIAGKTTISDPTGSEFASEAAARRSAETRLRHLRRTAPSHSIKIVVKNAVGDVLFEVDDVADVTDESLISERAKAIWEREGRPEGRDKEIWNKATEELRAELGDDGQA